MTLDTSIIVGLLSSKVALDYFSAKHPSGWFDAIYMVLLFAIGVGSLDSTDSQSVIIGYLAIVGALVWAIYSYVKIIRKSRISDLFEDSSKVAEKKYEEL